MDDPDPRPEPPTQDAPWEWWVRPVAAGAMAAVAVALGGLVALLTGPDAVIEALRAGVAGRP